MVPILTRALSKWENNQLIFFLLIELHRSQHYSAMWVGSMTLEYDKCIMWARKQSTDTRYSLCPKTIVSFICPARN